MYHPPNIVYLQEKDMKIKVNKTGDVISCKKNYNKETQEISYINIDNENEVYSRSEVEIIVETPYELFGIECGKGWEELLKPIFDYINEYNLDKDDNNKIVPTQIKEKFGGLRFYTNFETSTLTKLIHQAEEESYNTCEICGSKNDVGHTFKGWLSTICFDCIKKQCETKDRKVFWKNASTGEVHEFN